MRRKTKLKIAAAVAVSSMGSLPFAHPAHAANGLWITNATSGGLWSNTANWNGGTVASGTDAIATFNTPSVVNTVNLDAPFTVGGINFNTSSTSNIWNVSNNAVNTNTLTLATSTGVPAINVLTSGSTQIISANLAGTQGFTFTGPGSLNVTGANTGLSGTVTILSGSVTSSNSAALGTGPIVFNPAAISSTTTAQMFITSGENIANNITMTSSRVGGGNNGTLITNGAFDATISGTIAINGLASSGGHIAGSTGTNYLHLTGAITDPLPANFVLNGAGNGIVIRSGNVAISGGGSYFRIDERSGTLRLDATNGVATNAFVNVGGNGNGVFDLNGNNQTLVAVTNLVLNTTNSITNSNTSSPSTLTWTPNPSSYSVPQFTNMSFTGTIGDASSSAPLSIVINSAANPNGGNSTGIQTFANTGNSYDGSTTIQSGTLVVAALNNGGSTSSIGQSSNAATNLVLGGGTLSYSGGSTSTDRNFTLSSGTTSTINVSGLTSVLTMTGGSAATSGTLNVTGNLTGSANGTLLLAGSNSHTGGTNVNSGTLLVNGSLTTGAVTVASGAALGGTGTIGGVVTPASAGIIAPGSAPTGASVGTLTVAGLTLNTGSVLNFEFNAGGSGSGNDQITVANSGGLTVNGATLDLYQPGTTTAYSTNGTYTLFNVTGSVGGSLSNFSIANPAAGKVYSLSNSGGAVSLTILTGSVLEWNDNAGSNNYSDAGNWIGGVVPSTVGQTALFGSNLVGGNGTVTLAAAETVSGISFNNSGVSYSLGGSGSLVLNNGAAAAAVDIINGQHSINVPISLSGAVALNTTNSSDVLTLSGNITGAKAVVTNGPGTVVLTGSNSFTTVTVNGGTLNVGTSGSGTLGTGAVTLTGGAVLNLNTASAYSFGQPISGAGSINQVGAGVVSVGAVSGVTTVNISSGGLTIVGGLGQSGGVNVTGSGSLTVGSGGISGAGALTVNTTGAVSLTGSSTYAGATTLTAGSLSLGAASTLPANSVLEVDGGKLDLHGNNITVSNFLDQTSSTGVITNNAASSTTSTIAFAGNALSYNLYAALNDGTAGGKVALTSNIANTVTGNSYILHSHSTGNYSGGTTVSAQSIEADATNAFGVGPITILTNNSSINTSFFQVVGGISLSNNIVIGQPNAGTGLGAVNYLTTSAGSTTLTGSVTQQADPASGGTFAGPTAVGDWLNINGQVVASGTATTISARAGNVGFGGGGSYPNLSIYGNARLNATNGIATNAAVNFPQGAPTLDMNGFNQSIAGLTVSTGSAVVTNSSTTPTTLTVNTSTPNSYAGGTLTGNLSLVKTGSSSLFLNGSSNYSGGTTISGGTLRLGPITQPSLVAAYSFDNTTATPVGTPTTITNSGTGGAAMNGSVNQTGGANVTIVSGGPVINGVSGNALNFDGTGGAVIIPSPVTDLSGTGSWTVSAWLNTGQSGSAILSKNSGGWAAGNSVFYLGNGASGAGTEPSAVRNGGGFETGGVGVSDGTWHMVTYVDNGGTETVYVDGVATTASQTGFTAADVGSEIELGLTTDTVVADGTVNMLGSLDDINIFSGALTASQITNLFSTNVAGALPPSYVLPSTTALNLTASGATLDLNGNQQAVASLTGVAGTQVILGGGTLLVGDSTTTTFAGTITDAGGASNLTGGSLVKQGSGTLTLAGIDSYSGTTTVNAGLLVAGNGLASVGTGNIIINAGGMILKNTSAGSVNALLKTGFNAGAWNGTGINSATAASDSTHLHAVGMLQPTVATTFEGQPLGTGDVALKYTYYGDANLDGKVDGSDYSRIDASFLSEKSGPAVSGWYNGDFNYDGVVNGSDYTLIDNAFNSQGAAIASQLAGPSATATAEIAGSGTSSAVPEPSALALACLATAGLLGRRRRV